MSVRESWSLEELEADVSQYESFLEEESAFLRARAIDAVSEQENAESLPEAAELRRVAPRNEAASTAPAVERKAEHKASVVQAEGGASGNVSEAELLRLISEERGRWQASLLASSARMAASLGAETPHNQSAMPAARRAPSPLASRPARRPQSAGAARRSRSQEPSPARGRRPSRAVASMLEAERRQLTFRPQLQPFASSRSSEARSSDVYARNREWQVAQDEKLLEKTRVAAEEEKRECSFRPHINPVSEALVELRRGGGAGGGGEEDGAPSRSPVEQRLLEVAQARTHSRELLRRQKEQEELRAHSFAPQINERSQTLARVSSAPSLGRPLYKRAADVLKTQRARMQELRQRLQEGDPNLTFRPTLNPRSRALASARSDPPLGDPERLVADATAEIDRQIQQEVRRLENERRFSFAPQINPHSEEILASSAALGDVARMPFLDRQRALAEKAPTPSFHPDTGNAAAVLANSRSPRRPLEETEEERVARLAHADLKRVQSARQRAADEYWSQFTFEPALNDRAARPRIYNSPPRSGTAGSASTASSVAGASTSAAANELSECTFKPALAPATRSIVKRLSSEQRYDFSSPERVGGRIEAMRRRRVEREQRAREEKEFEELKQCTFTPALQKAPVATPTGPVLVRGLNGFIGRVHQAARLRREQREREERVFSAGKHWSPAGAIRPEPFALSFEDAGIRERAERRRQRVASEAAVAASRECFFQPQTLSAQRSRKARALVEGHEEAHKSQSHTRRLSFG